MLTDIDVIAATRTAVGVKSSMAVRQLCSSDQPIALQRTHKLKELIPGLMRLERVKSASEVAVRIRIRLDATVGLCCAWRLSILD